MSRPTPYDFTQPSEHMISVVMDCMIVGLDKDGNVYEDIANPDYEAWVMFSLAMVHVPGTPRTFAIQYGTITIVTDGDYWFKVVYPSDNYLMNWSKLLDDGLGQLKLVGVGSYAPPPSFARKDNINCLHPNDKATINEVIKDLIMIP